MCMMCEEEAMYQAYLEYLARKGLVPSENAPAPEIVAPQANPFACDRVPTDNTATDVPDADQAKPKVA